MNHVEIQAACANIIQFCCAAGGSEILNLKLNDFIFTGYSIDSLIVGGSSNNEEEQKNDVHVFSFTQVVDISMRGLWALHGWLCVLRAHNLCDENIYM